MPRNPFYQGSIGSVFNAQAAIPHMSQFASGALGQIVGGGMGAMFAKPDPTKAAQADLYKAQAEGERGKNTREQGAYDTRAQGRTSMGAALTEAMQAYQSVAGGAPAGVPRATSPAAGADAPPRPATVGADGVAEVEPVTVDAPRRAAPPADPTTVTRALMPSMLKIAKAFAEGDFTGDELKSAQAGMGAIFSLMPQMDDSIARGNSVQGKYLGDNENVSVAGQGAQREDRQVQESSINDADNAASRANAQTGAAASMANARTSAGATVAAARINQDGAMARDVFGAANPKPGSVDPGDVAGLLPPGLDPALGSEVKRRAYDYAAAGMNPAQAVDKAIAELTESKQGWFGASKTVRRATPGATSAPPAQDLSKVSNEDLLRQLGE